MSDIVRLTCLLFVITVITRFIPFWFQTLLKNNQSIVKVGRRLPGFIICLLVIFELNPAAFLTPPYGIPSVISLLTLVLVHLWQRRVLLSMLTGLVCYLMILPFTQAGF